MSSDIETSLIIRRRGKVRDFSVRAGLAYSLGMTKSVFERARASFRWHADPYRLIALQTVAMSS